MNKLSKLLLLVALFCFILVLALKFIAGGWVPFLWAPLGLIFLSIAASIYLDRKIYFEFFTMKTTRHGLSMGSAILLVLILLVAVNVFSVRKFKTFDFSLAQINTLSEQSVQLVRSLKETLRILYFYKKGDEGVEANKHSFIDLVKKYQDQNSLVTLDFIEVNERPDLAEKYEVTRGTGVVFMEYKGKKNRIDKIDEQEFTSALSKLLREKEQNIYFLTGHGERDLADSTTAAGAGLFKAMLEGNNYKVNALNLTEVSGVPEDANMLFIIGPEQAFLESEIKAIEGYAQRGGSIVVALKAGRVSGIEPLLKKMGVIASHDFVVQVMQTPLGAAINPGATPVTEFSTVHPISKPFGKNLFALMVMPTSLKKADPLPQEFNFQEVAKTSSQTVAFSEKNFEKETGKGPFATVVAVTGKLGKEKEFSLVAFGDAEVFSNLQLYKNLNRDLAMNTAAFLSKDENLISISPKEVGVTEMTLTPNLFGIYIWGFVIPVPFLLMFVTGTLWYRRRHA